MDNDFYISTHWGKLASDILTGKRDIALKELNTLWDLIDSRSPSSLLTSAELTALTQLHSHTWHVHWSLFIYFNHPGSLGRSFWIMWGIWLVRHIVGHIRELTLGMSVPFWSQCMIWHFVSVIYLSNWTFPKTKRRNGSSILSAGPAWAQMLKLILRRCPFLSLPCCPSPITDSTCFPQDIIKIHQPPLLVYQSVIKKTHGLGFHTQAIGAAIARPGGLQWGRSRSHFKEPHDLSVVITYFIVLTRLSLAEVNSHLVPPFGKPYMGPFLGFLYLSSYCT